MSECKITKEWLREMFSRHVDEWVDGDLRITCQYFDVFEVGCFGCPHYDDIWDWRLTCHIEQEMRRRNDE